MENNWKEFAEEILIKNVSYIKHSVNEDLFINALLEFGNLVFEATKKECADKARSSDTITEDGDFIYFVVKESILNINKPNL